MRKIVPLLLFIVYAASLQAQEFGGNRPSLKFFQLNTDTVRIIFPKPLEKEAREIAWLSHRLAKEAPSAPGKRVQKIDVVLQNQTIRSNAYVGMAPWRSEFYMMPELNSLQLSALPWHQTLALHEYRHVQQFANFKRRIPRLLGLFFGQEGQALAMGAVIPDWYWEGDAVWQETVNSNQGRGRLPHFFNAYRSLWLDQKQYSFQKLRNGSFRHFVPNHYDLGYLLVSYGRERYGDSLWNHVNNDALDLKGFVYPFQKAVQRHTSITYKKFVNDAFQSYQQKMAIAGKSSYLQEKALTNPEKNNVVQYEYPYAGEDGSILALKSSYKQIPVWVRIDSTGKETVLKVRDISTERYFTNKSNWVVFTTYEPDARWGWQEYSVLKRWDIQTGEVVRLTDKSRLFMPDVSSDGSQVVAVHSGTDLQSELHLIRKGEKEVRRIPNPNRYVYTYPRFSADEQSVIAAVRNSRGEMTLLKTELSTGSETLLMPFVNLPIAYVQVSGDSVLFTAPNEQADAVFLYDMKSGTLQTLARLPNGNYQPYYDAKSQSLIWNSWSTNGTHLFRKTITGEKAQEVQVTPLSDLYFPEKVNEAYTNFLERVEELPGKVERYKPSTHLFNIHSWRPYLEDPDYGITFFSQNTLNTLVSEYNYNYNRNESSHEAGAALVWGGWYPQFSLGASQIWNRSVRLNEDTTLTWNQTTLRAGINLPLNFTSGTVYNFFTVNASYNADQSNFTGLAKQLLNDDRFQYLSTGFSWIVQGQQAKQHIYPRWAQTLRMQYRQTVGGETGSQLFLNAGLYVPGLARNHNLVLFASVQNRDTLQGIRYSNQLSYARGYTVVNFPRALRFSANYHFPILYPEFGVAQVIYFLRVRGNAFYDYTRGKSLRTGRLFPQRSAGMELFFDTRIWNNFPLSFGLRYSRLLDTDLITPSRSANQFELILPLDLY